MNSFRIAHLSDLHFSRLGWGLFQPFSKRWIGSWNLLLRRKREFDHALLTELPSLFRELGVDLVLITGDLSTTSLKEEFSQGAEFVKRLKDHNLKVKLLPGNHDHYTKRAYKEKRFYRFVEEYPLHKDQLSVSHLGGPWWLITLDTTLATPFFCCHGLFSKDLEEKLSQALEHLPKDSFVIIANHFPLVHPQDNSLKGKERLISLLQQHPEVKLYLHGHTHRYRISDKRLEKLPILVDSGSTAHRFAGSFQLITCEETQCSILPFLWKGEKWTPSQPSYFTLVSP